MVDTKITRSQGVCNLNHPSLLYVIAECMVPSSVLSDYFSHNDPKGFNQLKSSKGANSQNVSEKNYKFWSYEF